MKIQDTMQKKILGGHPDFHKILDEMRDLHDRKNNNYAEDSDPLSNLRGCEQIGLPAHISVFVRLTDKFSRIIQLAKGKPDLVGESMEDTLMDMAIYSVLAIILWREHVERSGK